MRYFDLLDFQYLVLALFIGIAVTILVIRGLWLVSAIAEKKRSPGRIRRGLADRKKPCSADSRFCLYGFFHLGSRLHDCGRDKRRTILNELSAVRFQQKS